QGVDRACGDYLWGIYWRHVGETGAAERQLRLALEQQPRREAAYVELAELFEEQSRWSEALAIWQQLARRVPQHAGALIGVARSLRKGGQADSARNWLLAIGPPTAGTEAWTLERAQLELDAAEYDSAAARLKSGQGDAEPDDERLTTAAQALALAGQGTLADELWEQVDWLVWRRARTLDLRVRLALDPSNAWLRQQWQDWQVEAAASRPRSNATLAGNPSETPRPGELQPSARYLQSCAACHGIPGQSPGRAARFLTPRPRDLAADPMRLVSTANGRPTLADIQRVLRQGIPGTAMPAFADWTDSDREALARDILAWRRASLDRRLTQSLQDTGDVLTAEQRAERVDELSQPGESLSVPEDAVWSQAAADRGATVYAAAGCAACHGPRGTPESPPWLYDSRGEPVAARDLQRDPFQGGDEPAAIYLRLAAGMPGTPHPSAVAALSPGDLTALTLFCRTLRQEPSRLTTNAERARRLDILSAESPVSVDPPSRSP
ncbi:MAG: c-type cytochrome, partial [Pirellulales bacterium]